MTTEIDFASAKVLRRRKHVLLDMSEVTKLSESRCDAYIKLWYEAVFQRCLLSLPKQDRISEDFISFTAEKSAWDAMVKHRELGPGSHPWVYGERPQTWKEGETECLAYTKYRQAGLAELSVPDAAKATAAQDSGEPLQCYNSASEMPGPVCFDSIDIAHQALENVSKGHRAYYQDEDPMRNWPCLPTWRYQEQGKLFSGGLFGINEILIVLRRIYAHDASLMLSSAHKDNALLNLSYKLPNSLAPDDLLLLEVREQLGRSLCDGRNPSFFAILHHEAMESIWTASYMRLFQPKMMFSKSGRSEWATWDLSNRKNDWINELTHFNGHGSIQQLVNSRFQVGAEDGYDSYFCCNFPPIIRVHYKPSDDPKCPKYEDLQSFDLTAPRLSEDDITKPSGISVNINMATQHYNLIACVFERNKPDDRSEVRTYSLSGKPYVPYTPWQGGWDKRMGTLNANCFLFYGKCQPQIRLPASEVNPAAAAVCFQNLLELSRSG